MADSDQNADLRALVDQSPDGVIILRDGLVEYVNSAFAAFLGRSRQSLVQTSFLDLLVQDYREPMVQWLQTSPETGRHGPSEYGFLRASGLRVTLQLTPMWLRSFGGGPARAFIARDISLVKQTQADLLLADRMMTVGALASGVAHEINNPMAVVIGNLHYVRSAFLRPELPDGVDMGEIRQALDEALDSAGRVARIVKNFNTFSRADSLNTGALSLPSVVESALTAAFVPIRRKAQLVRHLRPTPPVVANEARLGQVILNLILNAVQALPENQSTSNSIEVATFEEEGQAVFQITDSGPGISPQVLNHVFDPFFTTKPLGVGTGLGLSIAHSIVQELGGTIDVSSVLGAGTTFTVRLPPQVGLDEDSDEVDEPRFVPAAAQRILVVDDEPLIISAFRRVLQSVEHEVAHSGREAVEILAKNINFSVIFCDLYMPEVSGMDVFRWVQKTNPGLEHRIVFMTGGVRDAVSQSFLDQLPNRRLNKPFNPEEIHRMIRRFS